MKHAIFLICPSYSLFTLFIKSLFSPQQLPRHVTHWCQIKCCNVFLLWLNETHICSLDFSAPHVLYQTFFKWKSILSCDLMDFLLHSVVQKARVLRHPLHVNGSYLVTSWVTFKSHVTQHHVVSAVMVESKQNGWLEMFHAGAPSFKTFWRQSVKLNRVWSRGEQNQPEPTCSV